MTIGQGDALEGFIDALLDDNAGQLYERAPCGYLSTTPDGTIIKANETFFALTGYRRGELVGRVRFAELLSPGGQIYHETHYAPLLRMQGTAREIAFDVVRADGERLPVLVNSVLERDAQGHAIVIRTAVFDASQRREYERELLRAKQRAEESEANATRLAHTLQQTLIPPTPPVIPQLDIAARYRPAGDGGVVGGDFYDVFQVADEEWVVAVGDVCGKGVDAAVVTALARYTLRAAAMQHSSPAAALTVLNAALLASGTDRFCTVACLRLHRESGGWQGTLALGGHPRPVLASGGTAALVGEPGSLLGVLPEPEVTDLRLGLAPGESLLLYTDGVPEGRDDDRFYGIERLLALVGMLQSDADELAGAVLDDVLAFQQGTARDDIALVALRVPAGAVSA
ncbi:MAG TPA: SpoIIE family protein phosphatase [Mycobacteriales bacterium]|nr:SpoIIE family protein phosphatase [Mycobacteriales bacterium]